MSRLERQQKIISILNELEPDGSITVKELAGKFYFSESSIRRDIAELEKRGLITHIYGGVTLNRYKNTVVPISIRDSENYLAKEIIAKKAAELINNGDTVFLDSSSTSRRILKYIDNKKEICIITNNLRVLTECENEKIKLYSTGGAYNPKNHNFLGSKAERFIESMTADILFFSAMGISYSGDINDISEEENAVKAVMIRRAKRKIFLCDSSKVGVSKLHTLCSAEDVDLIICDKPELVENFCSKQNQKSENF